MNICFYTIEQPSAANELNINYLIQNRPGHNYSFLNIQSDQNAKNGLKDKIRTLYSEIRFNDGRFEFQRDLLLIQKNLGACLTLLDKNKFKNGFADEVNDNKSVQFLKETKPDLIIQAGAGIMKPNTFSLAQIGTINLHHGIMPEVRGIESTFWCLFYGIKEKIGVSCHFIDETLDTGVVIAQSFLNTKSTTFVDIQMANYLLGRDVLIESVDIIDKGGYTIKTFGEVKSYYFGNVNPFLYYALKKRDFTALMKISDKAFKMKEKRHVDFEPYLAMAQISGLKQV